jgi:MFS transporter, MHS family, shikimate and dehydroshikimate transport protein
MSETVPASASEKVVQRRRAIVSGTLGSSIEWYDFYLYGVAAATIFNRQFFPAGTSVYVGTLLAFSTYAVGFLARPLGAVIFGHFGDRIGRKKALVFSLLLMGTATVVVGLLPTYGSIGIAAPLILTVMRFLQGIGVGGEWAGATLMVTEQTPPERRGFWGSLPQLGVAFGALTANGAFVLASALIPDDQFSSWGWRIPFLISAVLVAVGLYIRLNMAESPAFTAVKESGKIERLPVWQVVRQYPTTILKAGGIRVADVGIYYVWTSFFLAYAVGLGFNKSTVLTPTLVASAIAIATIPMWGFVSDKIGRRPTIMFGAVSMAVLAFPLLWAVNAGVTWLIALLLVLGINIGRDACYAPQAAYFTEMFPPHLRYSGASLGPQLAAIFGGCAPLIATAIAGPDYAGIALVAGLVIVMAVVTFTSALVSKETAYAKVGRDVTLDYLPPAQAVIADAKKVTS